MEYLLKFGSVEYKIYEAECTALRLKRKCELIRAKKNRQETIVMAAIEERLDAEFTEYQEQLNQQFVYQQKREGLRKFEQEGHRIY